MRILWQTVRRITNEILGVKGLIDLVLKEACNSKKIEFSLKFMQCGIEVL